MTVDERQILAGNDELAVGQQVLARSSVNDGNWCNAVVISPGHRYSLAVLRINARAVYTLRH